MKESDLQQLRVTSIVNERSSKSQYLADADNALLDCIISQGVVGLAFRNLRVAASMSYLAA